MTVIFTANQEWARTERGMGIRSLLISTKGRKIIRVIFNNSCMHKTSSANNLIISLIRRRILRADLNKINSSNMMVPPRNNLLLLQRQLTTKKRKKLLPNGTKCNRNIILLVKNNVSDDGSNTSLNVNSIRL